MSVEIVPTIRDTPLARCIGARLIDITSEDEADIPHDPPRPARIYLHFDNGETIFATPGGENSGLLGVLDNSPEE